jgi:TusA-related sulfurtransferase
MALGPEGTACPVPRITIKNKIINAYVTNNFLCK